MTDIYLHEEHHQALATFEELGFRKERLLCFDRHLDLKAISPANANRIIAASSASELYKLRRSWMGREFEGAYGIDDVFTAASLRAHIQSLKWVSAESFGVGQRRMTAILSCLAEIPITRDSILDSSFDSGGTFTINLFGIELSIDDLDSFSHCRPRNKFQVDIDLDWFCCSGATVEHEWHDLFQARLDFRHYDQITLSYSTLSGFFPKSRRDIINPVLSDNLIQVFYVKEDCDFDEIVEIVSEQPSQYHSAIQLGIDAARRGELFYAQHVWHSLVSSGVSSPRLAYAIACLCMRLSEYRDAITWFNRTGSDPFDNIVTRARFSAIICKLRINPTDKSVRSELDCYLHEFPFDLRAQKLYSSMYGQPSSTLALVSRLFQ